MANNRQFVILLLLWTVVGVYFALGAFVLLPMTLYVLREKKMYVEIFLGFLYVLVLSDNLIEKFVFPVYVWDPLGFAKTLKYEYIVLITLICMVDLKRFQPINKLFASFLPFLIISLFSFFSYPNSGPVSFFEGLSRWVSYLFLFFAVPQYVLYGYRTQGKQFLKKCVHVMAILIVIGYLLVFVNPEFSHSHHGRLRGIFGNPNGLGMFTQVGFILFYILTRMYDDLFTKRERGVLFAVFVLGAILSGSRNAVMSIGIFYGLAQFTKVSIFGALIAVLALALITPSLLGWLPQIISALGLAEYFRLETLEEGSGRLLAWQFAWQNIQDYLLLGRGFGYDLSLMRSNYDWLNRAGHEGGVHNTYLIIWLNSGLIGLVAFFRSFFLAFIKASKLTKYAFPAMIGIMLSITFEPWLAASLNPYTIIFLTTLTVITEKEFFNEPNKENIIEEQKAVEGIVA